jgi:hypothetical protein
MARGDGFEMNEQAFGNVPLAAPVANDATRRAFFPLLGELDHESTRDALLFRFVHFSGSF